MPLKAKKYLALPIQSMLGCLKSSIIPLLLPYHRLQVFGKVPGAKPATQGIGICEENLLPARLDSNGTLAPALLVRPKCSIRPDGPASSGDTGKSFSKRRSR